MFPRISFRVNILTRWSNVDIYYLLTRFISGLVVYISRCHTPFPGMRIPGATESATCLHSGVSNWLMWSTDQHFVVMRSSLRSTADARGLSDVTLSVKCNLESNVANHIQQQYRHMMESLNILTFASISKTEGAYASKCLP